MNDAMTPSITSKRDETLSKMDRYLRAATRDNTRRSYQSAIEHYEVKWGGFLPATAEAIARYLADYADSLAVNTLKQRLAALSQWHSGQGFPDPTQASVVKKVLKGIKALHPAQEKRAKPLQLDQLTALVTWIEGAMSHAFQTNDSGALLRLTRNRALVLIGFWRGFRSDELSRLYVENIEIRPHEGMILFLPRTKSDRNQMGTYYKAPALTRLCPVSAYQDWLACSGLMNGPVFRRINRWGQLGEYPLNPNSMISLLRQLFQDAGLADPNDYSTHSLRRGFATWANAHHWDIQSLMEYVGWKDIKSALRYIERDDPYAQARIESALADCPGIGSNNSSKIRSI